MSIACKICATKRHPIMATTRYYLDTRHTGGKSASPLKLAITKRGQSVYISLGVELLPSQWDARAGKVVCHPRRQFLNTYIAGRKQAVDDLLLRLTASGELAGMTAAQIKERVIIECSAGQSDDEAVEAFASRFKSFVDAKDGRTKELYQTTLKRIAEYAGATLDELRFEDITPSWLSGFDAFMSRTSPSRNARNIHLRNIRAVFNDALDDEVTSYYPFRKFHIRPVPTAKRSLPVEELRALFGLPVADFRRQYLDMFKLIFCLIGINIVDLCRLRSITQDGRIEYHRAKTHRLYTVKVEPEAMDIIERYRGKDYLLNILDRCTDYRHYAQRLNSNLQQLHPGLTTYWARHSWATTAASLDIPKETIAAALGHGGNTVTDIYIDFDRSKVDEANRRVLDWVLYGKR